MQWRDSLLNCQFRTRLEAYAQLCCKCAVTTWLKFDSPSSPYGKLACRSCAHVACTECSLSIPCAVHVPTNRMQVQQSAIYGWICSAPGCGWSQVVDLESLAPTPTPVGCLSGLIWSWTKDVLAEMNGVLIDFEQQTCRVCSHACCIDCAKFQIVDSRKDIITPFSILIEASKNAYLGSLTPQYDLVVASKQAYQNLMTARAALVQSSAPKEASAVSFEPPPAAVIAPEKALQTPHPTYSLFPKITSSPPKPYQPSHERRPRPSQKIPVPSSLSSESSETSLQPSTEQSLHVHWADPPERTNLHRTKAQRLPKRDPQKLHSTPNPPSQPHTQHLKSSQPGQPKLWMAVVSLQPSSAHHDFPQPSLNSQRPLPLRDRRFSWDAETEMARPDMAHVVGV